MSVNLKDARENDVLVIVDMQNDFITGVLGSEKAQGIVGAVSEAVKEFRGTVILTRDIHCEQIYKNTVEGKTIPLHCEAFKNGSKICEEIIKAASEKIGKEVCRFIISKETFMPINRLLESHLDCCTDKGTIYICGVCTDICVVSTALYIRSLRPYNRVVVVKDLCAGTSEEAENAAELIMRKCCIEVETEVE